MAKTSITRLSKSIVASQRFRRLMVNIPPLRTQIALIVSQNPDDPADSQLVERVGQDVPVAVHVHYQWGYLSPAQQERARRAIRRSTLGIVPAHFLKADMEARFPNVEWHVVANGVCTNLFFPTTVNQRHLFKRHHGLSDGAKLVGCVGRLENAKGLQLLERVATLLVAGNLVLFVQFPYWEELPPRVRDGYANAAAALRLLSPDRVIVWPDRHPFLEDRPTKYFDVLLSPSLSEVQPLVVLEALISGVPVVATLSSPFFDEFSEQIRAFGLAGPSCTTVPIPARFASGDLTRADLALTSDELDDVAPRLFDLIAKTRVPSDIERHELAAKVINAGYTPKAMTAKLAVLYQRAEDMHNARTQLRADDR